MFTKYNGLFILLLSAIFLSSCTSVPTKNTVLANNTYIPIGPFPIQPQNTDGAIDTSHYGKDVSRTLSPTVTCVIPKSSKIIDFLPDTLFRSYNYDVKVKSSLDLIDKLRFSGDRYTYKTVMDYLISDIDQDIELYIKKTIDTSTEDNKVVSIFKPQYIDAENALYDIKNYNWIRSQAKLLAPTYSKYKDDEQFYQEQVRIKLTQDNYERINVPTYIAIGIRLIAEIESNNSNLSITGLQSINKIFNTGGTAGSTNTSTVGSINIELLGIQGQTPSNKINIITGSIDTSTVTTIASTIDDIKKLIYTDKDNITLTPRIVAISLPFKASQELVDNIVSNISQVKNNWNLKDKCTYQPETKKPKNQQENSS